MFKTKRELNDAVNNEVPYTEVNSEKEFDEMYSKLSVFMDKLMTRINELIDIPYSLEISTHNYEWYDFRLGHIHRFIERVGDFVNTHFSEHEFSFNELVNQASLIIPEAIRLSEERYQEEAKDFDLMEATKIDTKGWSDQEILDYAEKILKDANMEPDTDFDKLHRLYCNISHEYKLSTKDCIFEWYDIFFLFSFINCTFVIRSFEQFKILKKLRVKEFEDLFYAEECEWWVNHEIESEMAKAFERIQNSYSQAMSAQLIASQLLVHQNASKESLKNNARVAASASHQKEKRFLKKCLELYDKEYSCYSFRRAAQEILEQLSNDPDRLYDVDNPAGKSYANPLERWLSLWVRFKQQDGSIEDFLSMTKKDVQEKINRAQKI